MINELSKLQIPRLNQTQRGTSMLEYVLALSLLLVVFVVGGLAIRQSASDLADKSFNKSQHSLPCNLQLKEDSGMCA